MKLITVLATTSLFFSSIYANTAIDNKVLEFEKKRFSQNKRIKIKDAKINMKKEMPQKGWYGYIVDLEANMGGNSVKAKDVVFSNGELIAPELFDIKTGMPLKDLMTPKLTSDYYDKSKLIAGNHNAKDKIVIFSDPLCPFCMDYVPDIISHVQRNNNSIALYYYHFPLLRIHPAAAPLSTLMEIGKEKAIKDIELKVYRANWDKYFDSKEKDAKKILEAFNKEFKTNITMAELTNEKFVKHIKEDMKKGEEVMVQGTPTIFVNGEQDKTKLKYEMLGN